MAGRDTHRHRARLYGGSWRGEESSLGNTLLARLDSVHRAELRRLSGFESGAFDNAQNDRVHMILVGGGLTADLPDGGHVLGLDPTRQGVGHETLDKAVNKLVLA